MPPELHLSAERESEVRPDPQGNPWAQVVSPVLETVKIRFQDFPDSEIAWEIPTPPVAQVERVAPSVLECLDRPDLEVWEKDQGLGELEIEQEYRWNLLPHRPTGNL